MAEKIAILGGNRIPFARSNGPYAEASNQDMLTTALDGLVARFGLQGERAGEVVAGAVLKHSRDFNLTRECVLGERARPLHPRLRRPAGLRHRSAGGAPVGRQDRARTDRVGHRRRRRHHSRRADRRQRGPAPGAARGQPDQDRAGPAEAARPPAPAPHRPRHPAQRRAAHRPVDGRAPGAHDRAHGHHRARRRTSSRVASHQGLAAAYERGFFDDLVTPYLGLERDQNLRPDSSTEKLAKLKPVFGDTMTAANSTPLSDGAAVVLLATDDVGEAAQAPGPRAPHRRRDRRGRLRPRRRRAADGAGRRRAAPARARRPDAAGLRPVRDPRGVRGPGAVHAEGVGGRRPRRDRPRPSSTSPAARSPPATRSPPPAGGSSPPPPSCSPSAGPAARWCRSAPPAGRASSRSWSAPDGLQHDPHAGPAGPGRAHAPVRRGGHPAGRRPLRPRARSSRGRCSRPRPRRASTTRSSTAT